MNKIIIFFAFALVILGSFANAYDFPSIPDKFFGTVQMDGANLTVGTLIIVVVGNESDDAYNMTQDGYYELYAKKGNTGGTIKFLINGKLFGTSTRAGGVTVNYNLSYTSPPPETPPKNPPPSGGGGYTPPKDMCGDKICGSTETSANCPSDCPLANITENVIIPCSNDWSCTDWSGCDIMSLTQSRKCTISNPCNSTLYSPAEKQRCVPEAIKEVLDELINASSTKSPAARDLIDRAVKAYGAGKYDLAAELARSAVAIDAVPQNATPTGFAMSATAKNGLAIAGIIVLLAAAYRIFRKSRH